MCWLRSPPLVTKAVFASVASEGSEGEHSEPSGGPEPRARAVLFLVRLVDAFGLRVPVDPLAELLEVLSTGVIGDASQRPNLEFVV